MFPGRRVTAHLMVQPAVATILFQDRLLLGQGIFSRILPTAPESAAGKRMPRPEQEGTDEAIKKYGSLLLQILETARWVPRVLGLLTFVAVLIV